jgi:hypothetical protein
MHLCAMKAELCRGLPVALKTKKRKEVHMTIGLRRGALALGLLGSAAFLPLPSYALDDDVEIDTPGASVEIERDRPGILPGRRHADDPDVYVETPGPDVYVEEEDAPPGATVDPD